MGSLTGDRSQASGSNTAAQPTGGVKAAAKFGQAACLPLHQPSGSLGASP